MILSHSHTLVCLSAAQAAYPDSLLERITTEATVVITNSALVGRIESSDTTVLVLPDDWQDIKDDDAAQDLTAVTVSLDDLAYVVFSSGTTGVPKVRGCIFQCAIYASSAQMKRLPGNLLSSSWRRHELLLAPSVCAVQ